MKSMVLKWGMVIASILVFTLLASCGGGTPTIDPDLPVLGLTPFIPHFGTPGTLGTLNPLGTLVFLGTPGPLVVEEYAPFCPATLAPLCEDPDLPVAESPCTPGVEVAGGGQVTLAGIGCPLNKQVRFDFDSNGGGSAGFSVEVNGDVFTCSPSPTKPDIFSCTGPEQPMGEDAVIVVCGGGTAPTPTPVPASTTAESGILLASLLESDPLNVRTRPATGGGGACPEGYIWVPDPEKLGGGECVKETDGDCPENWFVNALGTCATDREDSCPQGTEYDRRVGGCLVTGVDCPPGWIITENKTCIPQMNDHLLCPRGYYYNLKARCCQPVKGNNFGCDAGTYYDFSTKLCMPIDGNGCGVNQVYDQLGRCVGLTGEDTEILPQDKPAPGLVMRKGDLLGPGNLVIDDPKNNDPECGPDSTYVAALKNCIERDENGCPYGYHIDKKLGYCIPDDGPASTCPLGYRYNERQGCCVPLPGFYGSRCLEDEKMATALALGDLTFANSLFDPLEGVCVPAALRGKATPTPVPASAGDPCGEMEYFDVEAGYCVRLGPDCCPQGFGISCLFNKCMPLFQDLDIHTSDDECDEGYEFVKSWCVLDDCSTQGTDCTKIVANVPQCFGGCEVGLTMINGQCVEEAPDACASETCNYPDLRTCENNPCCSWDKQKGCYID